MGEPCCCCSGLIGEFGLSCDSCDRKFHFACGTGLTNVGERTITTYLADCVFRCPLCIIGEWDHLIPTVVTINQVFNQNKNTKELQALQKELSVAQKAARNSAVDDATVLSASEEETQVVQQEINGGDNEGDLSHIPHVNVSGSS